MFFAVEPFAHNRKLGRGVNILGYDPIWTDPAEGRMQDKHFRDISNAGFDHVRINLHPFKHMGAAPDYRIPATYFKILDWAVVNSLKNGLLVILDLHEFTAMAKDPEGLRGKFLAAWRQLSDHYQDYPADVMFEILNEPNGKLTVELWNTYLQEPLAIIRDKHPQRTVIIGPAFWNGIDYLDQLQLPSDDRHIIVTVHYYHPMRFTHQGAPWNEENRGFSGITWQGSPEEQAAISRDFAGVQTWSKAQGRPIYLGEFGAYDRADMPSRVRYTSAIARTCEHLGWSWGYWQFDSDFIVYDLEQDRWVEPIRDALIPSGG